MKIDGSLVASNLFAQVSFHARSKLIPLLMYSFLLIAVTNKAFAATQDFAPQVQKLKNSQPAQFNMDASLDAHRTIIKEMTDARFKALEEKVDTEFNHINESSNRALTVASDVVLCVSLLVTIMAFFAGYFSTRSIRDARDDAKNFFDRYLEIARNERESLTNLVHKQIDDEKAKLHDLGVRFEHLHDRYEDEMKKMKPADAILDEVEKKIEKAASVYRHPDKLRDEIFGALKDTLLSESALQAALSSLIETEKFATALRNAQRMDSASQSASVAKA